MPLRLIPHWRGSAADMAYEHDAEEYRSAVIAQERDGDPVDCYRHTFRRNRTGGGVCRCGVTVDRDEVGV